MVVEQEHGVARRVGAVRFRVRFVSDPRIETANAARSAVRLADELDRASTRVNEGDRLEEHSVFVALHTCGFRAVMGDGRRGPNSEPCPVWTSRWRCLRDYIVRQNIGLVHGCILRFSDPGLDRDELEGEGMFALVRAVDGFDPWRGIRLSTYAYNSIRRALILVSQKATKHRHLLSMVLESREQLSSKPAGGLDGLRWDRVNQALQRNAPMLSPREATVLGWRYPTDGGVTKTLGEVGDDLGISKERVRQIQQSAVQKLRDALATDVHLWMAQAGDRNLTLAS